MHFTALPTAWVSGFAKDDPLRMGANTAWVTETPGATAGFLEFKGDGLQTFERALDRVERLLAVSKSLNQHCVGFTGGTRLRSTPEEFSGGDILIQLNRDFDFCRR